MNLDIILLELHEIMDADMIIVDDDDIKIVLEKVEL